MKVCIAKLAVMAALVALPGVEAIGQTMDGTHVGAPDTHRQEREFEVHREEEKEIKRDQKHI